MRWRPPLQHGRSGLAPVVDWSSPEPRFAFRRRTSTPPPPARSQPSSSERERALPPSRRPGRNGTRGQLRRTPRAHPLPVAEAQGRRRRCRAWPTGRWRRSSSRKRPSPNRRRSRRVDRSCRIRLLRARCRQTPSVPPRTPPRHIGRHCQARILTPSPFLPARCEGQILQGASSPSWTRPVRRARSRLTVHRRSFVRCLG